MAVRLLQSFSLNKPILVGQLLMIKTNSRGMVNSIYQKAKTILLQHEQRRSSPITLRRCGMRITHAHFTSVVSRYLRVIPNELEIALPASYSQPLLHLMLFGGLIR